MFTGLVQAVGQVSHHGTSIHVQGCGPLGQLQIGDSVAVDGICLTVAAHTQDGFVANVSEETLRRTTLGHKANRGGAVNLEPALRLGDRLGGHLVSGHVDGAGEVTGLKPLPSSWYLQIHWHDPTYGRYICDKASVAVDGISLTVAGCRDQGSVFWLAVIPYTWSHTSLCKLRLGSSVNLEADLMAKYTERLLQSTNTAPESDLTPEWLSYHGWI
ncbi:riboflavin synthase [cyanobiont of Ornithocercus magnificus]|nr:riboflavin synthase [cyanobiont of Ornithocercus magnificus]